MMHLKNHIEEYTAYLITLSVALFFSGVILLNASAHLGIEHVSNFGFDHKIRPSSESANFINADVVNRTQRESVHKLREPGIARTSAKNTAILSAVVPVTRSRSLEKGVWIWESPYQMTATRMAYLVEVSRENGFNVIYLSIDDHLPIDLMPGGVDKDNKMDAYADALERFITLAHTQNISVDAVSGASDWAKPRMRYQPHALFRFAKRYNATHEHKLRAIQFDIEPYLLPEYKDNKEAVLTDYVSFVDEMATMAEESGLRLTFVIPHFFDRQAALTPEVAFAGHTEYVFTHMLQSLSRLLGSQIIVMAYRDTAEGDNGVILLSHGEVSEASELNGGNTTILIAQETGNIFPEYVTYFHTSLMYLNDELTKINVAFNGSRAYGGIAINHIIPYLRMQK